MGNTKDMIKDTLEQLIREENPARVMQLAGLILTLQADRIRELEAELKAEQDLLNTITTNY